MAFAMLSAGKRRKTKVDYAKLNSVGQMNMEEADLLELQADEKGEFDAAALDTEFEEEGHDDASQMSDWNQRVLAVNDENYKKERDNYEREMKLLADRERVIERERHLLEMKEGLAQKQKEIQKMERELANRTAMLNRYEENIYPKISGNWQERKNQDIDEWVAETGRRHLVQTGKQVHFTNTIDPRLTEHNLEQLRHSQQDRAERGNKDLLFEGAMALTNDNELVMCRETGTSRLRTMGLMPEQLLKKGRRSEPLTDPVGKEEKNLVKQASTSRLPGTTRQTNVMTTNPVIGKVDDGESLCSHDSKICLEVVRSEKSDGEKKHKLKSGMYAKVADDIVKQLKWPHKRLSTRWVPTRLQMNQLTFEQVVAGELAIIQKSTDPEEVRSRIHILQKVAYWNMQSEGWSRVREVYMSILHSIEEGDANFKSSFDEFDPMFPIKRQLNTNKKPSTKRDTYWCRAYNRGLCTEESPHKASIAGVERQVQHICANCWKVGKKERHPENDAACPQKEL